MKTRKFKQGQKVTIKDGSYMATVVNGKTVHGSKDIPYPGLNQDVWTVIGFGSNLPVDDSLHEVLNVGEKHYNNTIIANDRNNEVWYCNDQVNIAPVEKPASGKNSQDFIIVIRIKQL